MNKTVTVYSYAKVWKIEKKIYVIGKIVLPTPVNPYDLFSFILVILVIIVFEKMLPIISQIPFALKYFVLPLFVTNYFRKKKLDGKNPMKYFWGCLKYFFVAKGTYLQTFRKHAEKNQSFNLNWDCSMGR